MTLGLNGNHYEMQIQQVLECEIYGDSLQYIIKKIILFYKIFGKSSEQVDSKQMSIFMNVKK
ncbi:hypothetical protein CLPUN_14490 [Clostridium puniceum]|uniref:Uncharacterized protein n=2 Tax=Clostridium puniceum TaxID=29367 RepID=A0A1S8TQ30_9CLOT|nr:hypothetical protein CLPUN_14490 [Clostridium puniceum]